MSRTFIISRTDSIGDVVLTLPVAGVLRGLYPDARILFLGNTYTEEVIKACIHVDEFLNWDEWKRLDQEDRIRALSATGADTFIHVFPRNEIAWLAKRAGIETRIGTTNRGYHWPTCNKLVRLSRRHSPYHEAQLNLKLLTVLGALPYYPLEEIAGLYGFSRTTPLDTAWRALLDPARFNLIIHPRSKGSAREWGLHNFSELIDTLPPDRYSIFVTGTAAEGKELGAWLRQHPSVTDLTGKMTLAQFISFIAHADGLLAASTGPLHMAAALGIHAIGLFAPMRPIHPGRWAPIGPGAKVFVNEKTCDACRKTQDCACMRDIPPRSVKEVLDFVHLDLQPRR
jgi:lipopolysaccharide heptosyltransferase III